MTLIDVPAGVSLHSAKQRMAGRLFWLPQLLSDGADSSTSARSSFTFTGGSAHTMGSWVEIVSALSADVGYVKITPTANTGSSTVDTSALFDLGVGAGGAEAAVISSLGVGWWITSGAASHPGWLFPLFIPRGSRVAGRVQGAEASKSFSARFEFFAPTQGLIPSAKVVALGAVPASSRGTVLSSPGSGNTEGAWTEIVASTSEPYTALGVSVQGGSDTTQATTSGLVDIGVGAAGAETAVVSDIALGLVATEGINPLSPLVHPLVNQVPAGSRLSARWQNGLGSAPTVDVVLHGIRPAA